MKGSRKLGEQEGTSWPASRRYAETRKEEDRHKRSETEGES